MYGCNVLQELPSKQFLVDCLLIITAQAERFVFLYPCYSLCLYYKDTGLPSIPFTFLKFKPHLSCILQILHHMHKKAPEQKTYPNQIHPQHFLHRIILVEIYFHPAGIENLFQREHCRVRYLAHLIRRHLVYLILFQQEEILKPCTYLLHNYTVQKCNV